MIELYIILIFMIVGAVVAIEVKDLLSSVVAVGAVGLGLSLMFLILKAPDLAIVQLVVEILALIFMIRATVRKEILHIEKREGILAVLFCLVFIGIFIFYAGRCFENLPEFGNPIMKVSKYYFGDAIMKTGANNIVSAIILDFRAYDTLGEATVLFTAVIGALAVLREIGRIKREK